MSDSNVALNVTYDDKDSLFQYSNTSNRIRGDWVSRFASCCRHVLFV